MVFTLGDAVQCTRGRTYSCRDRSDVTTPSCASSVGDPIASSWHLKWPPTSLTTLTAGWRRPAHLHIRIRPCDVRSACIAYDGNTTLEIAVFAVLLQWLSERQRVSRGSASQSVSSRPSTRETLYRVERHAYYSCAAADVRLRGTDCDVPYYSCSTTRYENT